MTTPSVGLSTRRNVRRAPAPPKPDDEKSARKPAYLQRKMAVSQPQDKEEQEADKVARDISRAPREAGPQEDKEMISSRPAPGARRLQRRVNRMVARQAATGGDEGAAPEEPLQARRAARAEPQPTPEQPQTGAAPLRRSVETEAPESKAPETKAPEAKASETTAPGTKEPEQVAPRLHRKASGSASPTAGSDEEPQAATLRRQHLQRAPAEPQQKQEEEQAPAALHREQAPAGDAGTTADSEVKPAVEERIAASRGKGSPLPPAVLADMSTQLGHDFSHVVVHSDAEAAELCKELSARAFTVGSDVYFGPGEFAPATESGRALLAHELTHVVQHSDSVQTRRIAREPAAASAGTGTGAKSAGKGILKGDTLHVPSLTLPDKPGMQARFIGKYGGLTGWKLPQAEERTDQIGDWKKAIKPTASGWNLAAFIGTDNQLPDEAGGPGQYALKLKGGAQSYLIGTEASIRDQAVLPWWNSAGAPHAFDVDHILELQLGGEADQLDNFQLLDASANRSSGSRIHNALDKAISAAIPPEAEGGATLPPSVAQALPAAKGGGASAPAAAPAAGSDPAASGGGAAKSPRAAAMDAVKSNFKDKLIFDEVKFSGSVGGNPGMCWPAAKINSMDHLKVLEKATKSNAPDLFATDKLRLMPRPGAGVMFVAELKGDPGSETFSGGSWGGLTVGGGTFNRSAGSGTVTLTMPKTKKVDAQDTTLNFVSGGAPTLCHIPPGQIADAYRNKFKAKTLSPIVLNQADMDPSANIIGGGVLTIDGIPLLAGTTVDINLVGGDLVFSKTFSTDEFDMKGPVQLDSSSLTLSAGAATPIEATGLVEFHIGELARGSLLGSASASGFAMTGQLEFDKELFTGSGTISYDSAKGMKASGTLGLKPGALKGIKKASFTLAYDDSKKAIDFAGDAELSVPGFKGAKIAASADDTGNVSLAGAATLSDTIPRVKAGKLTVAANRQGGVWSLGGGGELEPDLEGMDASAKIALTYLDGSLDGKLTAAYKRSMVSGNVTLNAKASVAGGGDAEPIKVWGSGTVDVTAAPWLKATVGLTLSEAGEITVSGELGLPSSLEIFPRKEINKSLFSLATQVPIVPGVVAEVGGSLSASAGIGPGSLDQLKIGITYNPDRESETRISGGAHLKVPADAGLRLAARAGIGLGITGASATGGLEIGGMLGIDGAAEAGVTVDWTPATGLDINSTVAVRAQPSFTFDISGYVAVTALGFSVYEQRWQLAAYSFGSGYEFGISLPIHYHEGQPFNVSLDDVAFEVPDIDPGAVVNGLLARIV